MARNRDRDDGGPTGVVGDEGLAGLLAELEAWDDEILDGLGSDVLRAALVAFEEREAQAAQQHVDREAAAASGPTHRPVAAFAPEIPDTLLGSARLLAETAVQSLLAAPCAIVRGTCPSCHRPVALHGCGQAPDFTPSIADVAALKRFERELQRQDDLVATAAGPRGSAPDQPRAPRAVAAQVARLLDELGGLDRLRALFGRTEPEGSAS